MFNTKKFKISLVMILAVGLVISLSAADSFEQGRNRNFSPALKLKLKAKKNGYKIRLSGQAIYAQANNVVDPFDGKVLEGMRRILFRCLADSEYIILGEVQFTAGNSAEFELQCDLPDQFKSGSISVWTQSQ